MEPRRLYRSRSNRWLGGVCGGLAEYFNIDPLIIRLLFLFIIGPNLLVYILCLILIPSE
ncbi:MAG: PspC domain-containing protein [Oscillospiraceae bacterium]|nr:PspC domain-containing protein [Oscillospiraceae bacterium]MCL2279285.1 PspC domain-containing protein [Oscillospiraceae bacterium]